MTKAIVCAVAAALSVATLAHAESMQISANGSRPSAKGPDANFTGSVVVDPLYAASADTHNSGGLVSFEPGARSAWHSHPAGQTLIIVSGTGWIQEDGGAKHTVKPGDVIWTPPGLRHWHGATSSNGVSHIAITNVKDGKNVEWQEKVSDAQYLD
ncbi:cupin domain-containing protein [Asticcacaulis sp. ZE23SCel15]|uniref:(R)-mandelonitrile lyase n=1 Tax=Asticcacaulis sp. ZE23SCel15 TaxID=3059027 RepID=UPI00265E8C4E|nr:cupin domain-containing protein [Asticcacaulis sp. ZE23SCel15]WKL56701.1 cupin domain-containing protein [Asticcacaulis sp. ZE23SCel15]